MRPIWTLASTLPASCLISPPLFDAHLMYEPRLIQINMRRA